MIRIENFTKVYGNLTAVKDFTLHVEQGDIFGFIGPNGAGKTTTIRFLATLLKPTSGQAWVNGFHVIHDPMNVRRSIGYMPDNFGVYEGMRIWEYLDFFAAAYNIKREKRKEIIRDVIQLLDLEMKQDDFVEALSRGMKQRLCLAKTLLHDPKVLILDEPASGLDPRARHYIKELLKELQRMGKTIFISSHILSELADCCNKIGIMEHGVLLASGDVKSILGQVRENLLLEIEMLEVSERAVELCREQPGVQRLEALGTVIRLEYVGDIRGIPKIHKVLLDEGIPVLYFREVPANLEEVFMKVTKGEVA
ncbi:MAG TPA: ABC transporter ATP-binding protein [bacterium]|mgnify:CR=1 FL=1|nr:ABC transporter ATP-binding protein [bacterium]HPO07989.1 ABC transporter ATP-binding protein [bacterium]HQP98804.1 ABC transporter ATP-binding protein [bacterium]